MIALHLVGSIQLVAISWLLMVWACRVNSLSRPTFLGVGYLSFLGMHYFPAVVFLFDPSMSKSVPYLWASTIALVMFPVGGLYANMIMKFNPGRIAR